MRQLRVIPALLAAGLITVIDMKPVIAQAVATGVTQEHESVGRDREDRRDDRRHRRDDRHHRRDDGSAVPPGEKRPNDASERSGHIAPPTHARKDRNVQRPERPERPGPRTTGSSGGPRASGTGVTSMLSISNGRGVRGPVPLSRFALVRSPFRAWRSCAGFTLVLPGACRDGTIYCAA